MCGTLDKLIIMLVAIMASSSCTRSNPAPPGWRVSMKEAQRNPRGAWISLELDNGATVRGELIAVDREFIYVETLHTLVPVKATDVVDGELSVYEADNGGIAGVAILGTLSTISHGVFLIYSAPLWMLSGWGAMRVQSGQGYRGYPLSPNKLRPYARFPQGLPQIMKTPRGSRGGLCYDNGTCNRKLRCDVAEMICVPDKSMGTPGGLCYPDWACDPGLVCDATTKRCKAPPPSEETAPESGAATP